MTVTSITILRFAILLVLLVTEPWNARAESNTDLITIGHRFSIASESLGARSLFVSLPPEYSESSDPFPVIYLLDAETHFVHAVGVVRFLAYAGRIPSMIIIGIPNPTIERRARDLTPPVTDPGFAARFPDAGGMHAFLNFLDDEVRPWVGSQYRVGDQSILAGHSFGGLVVLSSLVRNPSSFQGYISMSPSLWWDDGLYARNMADEIGTTPPSIGALYITMANEAEDAMAGAREIVEALSDTSAETFRWKWSHMVNEEHASVTHRSLYNGLEWYFQRQNQNRTESHDKSHGKSAG